MPDFPERQLSKRILFISLKTSRSLERKCDGSIFSISAFQHFSISAFQHFSISAFQHFSISAFQHFHISAFPHFRISAFQHFSISTFQHFNISAFQHLIALNIPNGLQIQNGHKIYQNIPLQGLQKYRTAD
jgi:hypothetical protein